MIDLPADLKKEKIILLYKQKKFEELENFIELLGDISYQDHSVLMVYAAAKSLKKNSNYEDISVAIKIFEKIYRKNQNNLEAFYNLLANSLKIKNYKHVFPHLINRFNNHKTDKRIISALSTINSELTNSSEAFIFAKQLTEIEPNNYKTWENLMARSNYVNKSQNNYKVWADKLDKSFQIKFEPFVKTVKKDRKKIKLAFISSNLKDHSVSFFLKDFLNKINKKDFELFAFSGLKKSMNDEVTLELKTYFDKWHDTIDLSDIDFLKLVRSSDIDIAIDCNGLTHLNRIQALKARCAPIQISWLGYCNTIGIKNMDYIIADPHLIKLKERNLYSEKIIYMPKIWSVMSNIKNLPKVNKLPAKNNSVFTFGSFNNFKKISDEVIVVWSKILNESNSRLILKSSSKVFEDTFINLKKRFTNHLKDLNKIIFLDKISEKKHHLKEYNKIDLALDTFPYPGVTTSFESILMGVPVLTMKGFNFNSRCGESINSNLEMKEFIAENNDDYFSRAISITKNINNLSNIRESLRQKALKSSLFDVGTFTSDFSSILKKINQEIQ